MILIGYGVQTTMAFLNALPFDMQAEIASRLSGSDLANLAQAVPDFQPFFQKTVAPVFLSEFKRVSKVLGYLRKIFYYKPSTHDVMEDDGDHHIMSYILDREVEEGEIFEDKTDYCLWRTLNATLDLQPSMPDLVDQFAHEWRLPDDMPPNFDFLAQWENEYIINF